MVNVPVPAATTNDAWVAMFRETVAPAARRFRPDFVLISAGFDGYRDDPLGSMGLTEDDYAQATRTVCALAEDLCDGRIVSVLEGGYSLPGLGRCVVAHVRELMA
jgi:acetoin utilization deacetylase AcuC-like enzyme